MGVFLYDTLIKAFPEQHPITVINQSLLLYFAGELVLRFLLQSLPIREVKPLLVLPVPKAKIVRGVMMQSFISWFNFILPLVLIPFCFDLITKTNASFEVWIWFLAVFSITLVNNLLIFVINKNTRVASVF